MAVSCTTHQHAETDNSQPPPSASPTEPSEPPLSTWRPPTFDAAMGWNVVSSASVPIDSDVLPETWAANVPFAAEDLDASAEAGQLLGWPRVTMRTHAARWRRHGELDRKSGASDAERGIPEP
jgi:hypothetical protein